MPQLCFVCLLALSALAVCFGQSIPGHDASRKQVLLLTGYNSTRNHDWRTLSAILRQTLEETKEFEVRINEEPRALTPEVLRGYDVLVLDYSNYTAALAPPWPEETRKAYLEFVLQGGGVVAFHAACGSFQDWPEYRKTLGITEHNRISHGPYHEFVATMTPEGVALFDSLPQRWPVWGEIYNGMRLEDDAIVLARAFDDPENCTGTKVCGSGKEEPIIWTYRYGKGRSVVFTPGHDKRTMESADVVSAFTAVVRWAASRVP
jgi:type 1 glutamine amidotransferase